MPAASRQCGKLPLHFLEPAQAIPTMLARRSSRSLRRDFLLSTVRSGYTAVTARYHTAGSSQAVAPKAAALPKRGVQARASSTISINHLQVSKSAFASLDEFTPRHLGPREHDQQRMLHALGFNSIDSFINQVIPPVIRIPDNIVSDEALPPLSESELARRASEIAEQNVKAKNFIGMGYHEAVVPSVIKRNVSFNSSHPCHPHHSSPYRFWKTPDGTQGLSEGIIF